MDDDDELNFKHLKNQNDHLKRILVFPETVLFHSKF